MNDLNPRRRHPPAAKAARRAGPAAATAARRASWLKTDWNRAGPPGVLALVCCCVLERKMGDGVTAMRSSAHAGMALVPVNVDTSGLVTEDGKYFEQSG